jgi:obg-like ATPase 1
VTGAFDDADVIHVEGDVDPIRDMEVIQTELRYASSLFLDFDLQKSSLIMPYGM